METNDIFKKQAEEALAKQKKATRDFVLKIVPTGLWAAASIFTAASAFNAGNAFYVVTGIVSIIGALVFTIKTYKDYSKEGR